MDSLELGLTLLQVRETIISGEIARAIFNLDLVIGELLTGKEEEKVEEKERKMKDGRILPLIEKLILAGLGIKTLAEEKLKRKFGYGS